MARRIPNSPVAAGDYGRTALSCAHLKISSLNIQMEDTHSVCSGGSQGSVSLSKKECPYCNTEFQMRGLFNHIRLKHSSQMASMTTMRYLEHAEKGNPLCVYWQVKNDFDEEEEEKIYVCLASNKTFKTEERGIRHFKLNAPMKKDHIKQVKILKKEVDSAKKKKLIVDESGKRVLEGFKKKDPALARALWRGILYHHNMCQIGMHQFEKQQWSPDALCFGYHPPTRTFLNTTFQELFNTMLIYEDKMNAYLHHQVLDPKLLVHLYNDFAVFWDRTLCESMPGLRDRLKASMISPADWTEEYFFYANESMKGVEF